MRCQPAEKLAAGSSIVDAQEHVSAEVRRRPRPEYGRLDLMQVERRRSRIEGFPLTGSSTDGIETSFRPSMAGVRTGPDAYRTEWPLPLCDLVLCAPI